MRKTKNKKKKKIGKPGTLFFFFLGLTSARGGADVSNEQDTRVGSGRVGGAWRVDLKQKEGRKLHRRVGHSPATKFLEELRLDETKPWMSLKR